MQQIANACDCLVCLTDDQFAFFVERTIEDHEKVLQCLTHWPRTHNNHVLFKNNPEKYYLLKRPQLLMPSSHVYSSVNTSRTAFSEEQKKNIILKVSYNSGRHEPCNNYVDPMTDSNSCFINVQELFQSKILPKLEGELHIRDGKKSGWKKYMFSLRASGLYYSKAGKSLASKDISRLVEWKDVECYTGNQYKKFYRAPGPFCFSLVVSNVLLYSGQCCIAVQRCNSYLMIVFFLSARWSFAQSRETNHSLMCAIEA